MSPAFLKAFDLTLGKEGGYSDDPLDPGGETKFGISKRCLAPDTRIATRDLRWKAVSELKVGDELIGFRPAGRRATVFDVSKILAIGPVKLPAFSLQTSIGMVVCSVDHLWWTMRNRKSVIYNWASTSQLRIGDQIRIWRVPWEETTDRDSGYLAGLLDGEATINKGGAITFFQNDGPILDKFITIMKARAIHFAVGKRAKDKRCHYVRIEVDDSMRLLGLVRPIRLLASSESAWRGKYAMGRKSQTATVEAIRPLGRQELIGLYTDIGTLIAEGLMCHNSYPAEDIKGMTVLRAQEIYHGDFWTPLHLDEVSSPEISAEIFDTAVNAGKRRAAYIAQQALVYLGVTVAVDGTMGPETVRAINTYGDETALLKTLNGLQFMHYYNLVKADPSMTRFARGWLKRIEL